MGASTDRVHHLTGSPRAIGFAMGQRLGAQLALNITRYMAAFGDADEKFRIDNDRLRREALPWLHSLPQRFQEEFVGIAEGAGLPLQRVAEWFFIEQCAVLRCSSTVSVVDGHAWVARNNDTVAPGMWGYVSIKEVDGRIPTISFGREGDVFVPTGLNKERLWLHYNFLLAGDDLMPDKHHLPPFVFLMEALEDCRSIQEVERLLNQVQRSDGMLLFAVDGKTDEVAIFECGHTDYYKRDFTEQWIAGTNHYCMRDDPNGLREERPLSTLSRFKRLERLLRSLYEGGASFEVPEGLIRLLADDEIERRDPMFATVYATVACPHTGEIWYTFGGYPAASKGNWQRLEWPWAD